MYTAHEQHTAPAAFVPQNTAGARPVPPRPAHPPFVPQAPAPAHTPATAPAPSVGRARITLIASAALNLLLAAVALMQAQALRDSFTPYRDAWFAGAISGQEQAAQAGVGFAQLALVWAVLHGTVAIVLAARTARGGNAVRTAQVVFGAWQCLMGALTLAFAGGDDSGAVLRSLATLAGGALLTYLATRPDTVAWFNRPRR